MYYPFPIFIAFLMEGLLTYCRIVYCLFANLRIQVYYYYFHVMHRAGIVKFPLFMIENILLTISFTFRSRMGINYAIIE